MRTGNQSLCESMACVALGSPRWILTAGLLVALTPLLWIGDLRLDTRSDAFLAPDNPALIYRDVLQRRFSLGDPLVVAVHSDNENGIYSVDFLRYLTSLVEIARALPQIRPDTVIALPLEDNVRAAPGGLEISPFLEPFPRNDADLLALRSAIIQFPLYLGSLVSLDGTTTLIILNLEDPSLTEQVYFALTERLDQLAPPVGISTHVAGEGAVSGYLGAYIDSDARRLNPIAGLLIVSILVLTFRRWLPASSALIVIAASIAWSIGLMAAVGVPFYVITNALPVILVGISVADVVHLYAHFYRLQADHPTADRKDLILSTLRSMWRPITWTTLTTAAGFMGVYFAADMPPFKYFGLFAAIGCVAAWFVTLIVLPPIMLLGKAQVSQRYIDLSRRGTPTALQKACLTLGTCTRTRPLLTVSLFSLISAFGLYGLAHMTVDADRIELFSEDVPIRQADQLINQHMDGTSTLDIVIEASEPEAFLQPMVLARIDALQQYAETLPGVNGSTSIVDYLKQMNRSMNEGRAEAFALPDSSDLVAQYLMLYTFATAPDSLESQIDYDYSSINVRLLMSTGRHSETAPVIQALEAYLETHFSEPELSANLTGRVAINYHWIEGIAASHFGGVLLAMTLVAVLAFFSFRSITLTLMALVPVCFSVLAVYGFMYFAGLHLEVGTSMFAAVAVGLGVDFAIHTLQDLRDHADWRGDRAKRFSRYYQGTASALLINVLVVAGGFFVLIGSDVSQLSEFGTVVALAMVCGFLASVLLLPALMDLSLNSSLHASKQSGKSLGLRSSNVPLKCVIAVTMAVLLTFFDGADVWAEASLSAEEVVASVNAVPQGDQVTRSLKIDLIDRRGKERVREAIVYKRESDTQRKTVMFYRSPSNIRGTAFLSHDKAAPDAEDEQWLYLPALRKVKRVSAADRGDYFSGTDFTYEDMKLEGRLSVADYDYSLLRQSITGGGYLELEAKARTPEIADELGYSRSHITIDPSNWIIVEVEFWDTRGELLKTMKVSDVREIDNIWTRHTLRMTNHQTGHTSVFTFSDVDYQEGISERVFQPNALPRGD